METRHPNVINHRRIVRSQGELQGVFRGVRNDWKGIRAWNAGREQALTCGSVCAVCEGTISHTMRARVAVWLRTMLHVIGGLSGQTPSSAEGCHHWAPN